MKRKHRLNIESERRQTPEASAKTLLVQQFPTDRIYQLSVTESYYVFTHVGNELRLREELFPNRAFTDADRDACRKKDIWIEKAAVTDFCLTMKHCVSTKLPNNALLKLALRDGKKYTMILCMEEEKNTYLKVFREVANRRAPNAWAADRAADARAKEREARRLEREKRKKENEAVLAKKRTPRGCCWAAAACWGFGTVGILLFVLSMSFWKYRGNLRAHVCALSMGVEAAVLYLVWRWPMYFSIEDKDELRVKLVNRKNNMILQLLLPLSALTLTAVGRDHYDDIPALICVCLATIIPMIWGILRLMRKYMLPKGEMIGMSVLFLMFGAGLPLGLNFMLSSEQPQFTRTAIIEDMRASRGRYTSYYLTLKIGNEEHDYEISRAYYDDLSVGSSVTVGSWSGGLGIAYSRVLEPNQ